MMWVRGGIYAEKRDMDDEGSEGFLCVEFYKTQGDARRKENPALRERGVQIVKNVELRW